VNYPYLLYFIALAVIVVYTCRAINRAVGELADACTAMNERED